MRKRLVIPLFEGIEIRANHVPRKGAKTSIFDRDPYWDGLIKQGYRLGRTFSSTMPWCVREAILQGLLQGDQGRDAIVTTVIDSAYRRHRK